VSGGLPGAPALAPFGGWLVATCSSGTPVGWAAVLAAGAGVVGTASAGGFLSSSILPAAASSMSLGLVGPTPDPASAAVWPASGAFSPTV
jgi:hypothetical protein